MYKYNSTLWFLLAGFFHHVQLSGSFNSSLHRLALCCCLLILLSPLLRTRGCVYLLLAYFLLFFFPNLNLTRKLGRFICKLQCVELGIYFRLLITTRMPLITSSDAAPPLLFPWPER